MKTPEQKFETRIRNFVDARLMSGGLASPKSGTLAYLQWLLDCLDSERVDLARAEQCEREQEMLP